MLRRVALVCFAALILAAPAAALTKPQAIAVVQGILKRTAAKCGIETIYWIRAKAPALDRYSVTARIKQGGYVSVVAWTVLGNKKAVAGDPLAADLQAGRC